MFFGLCPFCNLALLVGDDATKLRQLSEHAFLNFMEDFVEKAFGNLAVKMVSAKRYVLTDMRETKINCVI